MAQCSPKRDGRDKPGHDDATDCVPTSPSAFRQLQLNAAVALVGFFGRRRVEWLEFGKSGGNQPLGSLFFLPKIFRACVTSATRIKRVSRSGKFIRQQVSLRCQIVSALDITRGNGGF